MGIQATTHKHLLSTAAAPLLLTAILYTLQHTSPDVVPFSVPRIFAREEEAQCPVDLSSPDACSLVKETCGDFNDGLIPYLQIYTCTPPAAQLFLLLAMTLWLPVLFGSMAVAAAEFLAVHLEYIVQTVGISENLAGVTIFAVGNGCTDLFATLAAMGANSGSLAIGELFGAAAFITTVVLGLITIVQPFTVDPRSFVGDVVWFMIAGSLLLAFLADGQLVLGECLGIIGLYVAFALFAILRPHQREQTTPVAVPPLSGGFRDEAESVASAEDAESDLLLPTDNAVDAVPSDGRPSSEASNQDAVSTSSDTPESPYVHEYRSTGDPLDNDDETSQIDAQELEDLGLPPAARDVHSTAEDSTQEATSGQGVLWKCFPTINSWRAQSKAEKILTIFSLPLLFPIGLTIPPRGTTGDSNIPITQPDPTHGALGTRLRLPWTQRILAILERVTRWRIQSLELAREDLLFCLQLFLGPQLFSIVVVSQSMDSANSFALIVGAVTALLVTAVLVAYSFTTADAPGSRKDNLVISTLAFTISLIWIYLTATSAVTLLMTLALLLNIPTALLGATIFAIGQSSNDLVANIAVAKRGMPVLAASATFGGPMMNMFLGIGGGGLVQVLKSGSRGVYTFNSSPSLFVSAANLLFGLGVTLAYAFWNSWRLERGLGIGLIGIWASFTIVNVGLSVMT